MSIQWIGPGEVAYGTGGAFPDVVNRPVRNVLADSGYASDGSDWAGFAKTLHTHAANPLADASIAAFAGALDGQVPTYAAARGTFLPATPFQRVLTITDAPYLAKMDGKLVLDATITTGTPTLGSPSAVFTAGDVGKLAYVPKAGAAGATLATSILAYVNPTTVTLATNALATVGRVITDAAITSGSTLLGSAQYTFTNEDIGKTLTVPGAGPAGAALTITVKGAYNGSADLAVAASTTVSGVTMTIPGSCLYGTDNTAALARVITAWYAANGGIISIPAGRCIGQFPAIPNTGGNWPRQPVLRLIGVGADTISDPHIQSASGSILELIGSASGVAKILTLGGGRLEIAHLTLANSMVPDALPFVYTTFTTIHAHDLRVWGNTALYRAQCNQAGFIFGGTTTTYDGTYNAPYDGYISVVERVLFDHLQRCVWLRVYANATVVKDCYAEATCGTANASPITLSAGAFEIDGRVSGGPAAGPTSGCTLRDNGIEMTGYVYGIKLTRASQNALADNGFYDFGAWTTSMYYLDPGSDTVDNKIEHETDDGTGSGALINATYNPRNTIISSHRSLADMLSLGPATGAVSAYPEGARFSNLGVSMATDFGSGSGIFAIANAVVVPTTNPAAGTVDVFVQAGVLKSRDSAGIIQILSGSVGGGAGSFTTLTTSGTSTLAAPVVIGADPGGTALVRAKSSTASAFYFYGQNYTTGVIDAPTNPSVQWAVAGTAVANVGLGQISGTGANDFCIASASGDRICLSAGNTNLQVVLKNGFLGIGVLDPGSILHIYSTSTGSMLMDGALGAVTQWALAGVGAGQIGIGTTTYVAGAGGTDLGVVSPAGAIYFGAGSQAAPKWKLATNGDLVAQAAAGKLITQASVAAKAGFNIAPGVAVTSGFVDGDEWTTATGRFCRIGGVTKQYTLT